MGSILHANAKTTPRIREEIQNSQESILALAERYKLNPKTIIKWKNADSLEDKKSGPKTRLSVLSELEQAAICTVRRHLRLSLDDLLIVFQPRMPALKRGNLHRCLQHHKLSKLPPEECVEKEKKRFKTYEAGYLHIDITQLHCDEGKYYLFVSIDRATKYVYAELYDKMTQANALQFLRNVQKEYAFKITHILTDNGAQFTYNLLLEHLRPQAVHPFTALCDSLGIEHRTTQFRHPWTNGQVEITNKVIKQATTKQFHYETVEDLRHHLMVFLLYYNHQRPLKALKFKTPWQAIEDCYAKNPDCFLLNPHHKIMGLNTYLSSLKV